MVYCTQDMNNDVLQRLQTAESNAIKINQSANKQEYQAQQLSNVSMSLESFSYEWEVATVRFVPYRDRIAPSSCRIQAF